MTILAYIIGLVVGWFLRRSIETSKLEQHKRLSEANDHREVY